MIVNRPLTEEEQDQAGKIYCRYVGMDAFAANCSGLTMQILLAVSFGLSTTWVSFLGSLTNLSYLLLPFGFYFAGKRGAGGNIRNFTWGAALMCCLVAGSVLLPSHQGLLFFIGVVLYYVCISCRSSMIFPLQKNITTDKTISGLLSRNVFVSSSVGLVISLLIAWSLTRWNNAVLLPLFFCIAAGFYFCSGLIISRITEPAVLKKLAARPIFPQVRSAWKDPLLRKQLGTGVILNLSLTTIVSCNLVAAKNGCGIQNSQALFLSTIQIISTIAVSYVFKIFTERFGPRKMMIVSYPLLWILAIYWCLIPFAGCPFCLLILPFFFGGMLTVFFSTSLNTYFTMSVPNREQLGGTFLVFTITGGFAGMLGILVNGLIFKTTELLNLPDPMAPFRIFYLITGLLSLPGILSPLRLPVKYLEYRLKEDR